jgi:two-component system LytT family response regulator
VTVSSALVPNLRVLIVDDERLARVKLRTLLTAETAVEVVADCQNGVQAIAAVRHHKPDLMFLDVRMPQQDGFQVLQALAADEIPQIVFTTAYDQYAIRAFDSSAVDYLLKPFDQERLHRAIERARAGLLRSHERALADRMLQVLSRTDAAATEERLLVKADGRLIFLNLEDIDWIEAAANYVRLNAGNASYVIRDNIGRLATKLDPKRFARIHRSIIINVHKLKELQPCDNGEFIAVLSSGKALSCSRGYRSEILRLIGAIS